MKKFWILAAALVLVLGVAGYTLAQMGTTQGGMMGSGMVGQSGAMGQGGQGSMTGGWMTNMMHGQPLTQEQLREFAQQHGVTVEQAKQMTDGCVQVMQAPGTDQKTQ
jgi:hypothetical protein